MLPLGSSQPIFSGKAFVHTEMRLVSTTGREEQVGKDGEQENTEYSWSSQRNYKRGVGGGGGSGSDETARYGGCDTHGKSCGAEGEQKTRERAGGGGNTTPRAADLSGSTWTLKWIPTVSLLTVQNLMKYCSTVAAMNKQ